MIVEFPANQIAGLRLILGILFVKYQPKSVWLLIDDLLFSFLGKRDHLGLLFFRLLAGTIQEVGQPALFVHPTHNAPNETKPRTGIVAIVANVIAGQPSVVVHERLDIQRSRENVRCMSRLGDF